MGFKVEACKACTLKCIRSHGNRANKAHPPTITISFFKIILADSSKPLFLPPKFARTLISSVDEDTYLEDSNGERWTVKLSTIDGSLAFQQGWHEFASDHSVNIGEMLIFKYIVESHFVVQIFGKNGCEKLNFSKRKMCDRRKRSRTGLSADQLNSFKEDRSSNPTEVPCFRNFEGQFGQMLPTKLGSYKPGDNNSGPEDLDEVLMATGKISHDTGKPQTASATNHNVPFRMVDQDSVSNQGGSKAAPINLSDSENFECESNAVFMDKILKPTNKSSQNCITLERTHTEKVSVPIEKAPHDEKSSERPQSASLMDYEAVPSCVFDKDSVSIKGGSMTEKSPRIGNGSGRFHRVSSIDLSQHTEAALHIINKDDMSKVPMPTKNSHNCNALENLDKVSLQKTPQSAHGNPSHSLHSLGCSCCYLTNPNIPMASTSATPARLPRRPRSVIKEKPSKRFANRTIVPENLFDIIAFRGVPDAEFTLTYVDALRLNFLVVPPPIKVYPRLVRLFYQNMEWVSASRMHNVEAHFKISIDEWEREIYPTTLAAAFGFFPHRPVERPIGPVLTASQDEMIRDMAGGVYASGQATTRSALPRQIVFWDTIVCSNLCPQGHQSQRTGDRVKALYAAFTDTWVDAPTLLHNSMWRCHTDIVHHSRIDHAVLYFPHFVMHLLRHLDFTIYMDELGGDLDFHRYGVNSWNKSIRSLERQKHRDELVAAAAAAQPPPPPLQQPQRPHRRPRHQEPEDPAHDLTAGKSLAPLQAQVNALYEEQRRQNDRARRSDRYQRSFMHQMAQRLWPGDFDEMRGRARQEEERSDDE